MIQICLAAGLALLTMAVGASPDAAQEMTHRTVYVPMFKNRTFRRGLEFDLTRAVIREIEARTPYKVVSDEALADTVLTGTILGQSPGNSSEAQLTVVVRWRSAGTGKPLPFHGGKEQSAVFVRQDVPVHPEEFTRVDSAIAQLAVKITSLLDRPW
jgi:hypothetical protein